MRSACDQHISAAYKRATLHVALWAKRYARGATRPSTIQRIAERQRAPTRRLQMPIAVSRAAWSLPQDVASEVASLDAALSAYSTRIKAAIIKGMPRAWRTGDEQAYVLRVDVSSMQV